jgi:hypothetical protein
VINDFKGIASDDLHDVCLFAAAAKFVQPVTDESFLETFTSLSSRENGNFCYDDASLWSC